MPADQALSLLLPEIIPVSRVFLTLAVLSTLLLLTAVWLGLDLGDVRQLDPVIQKQVSIHLLMGVAAIVGAVLVHAIVLTYFMGTGRWLEETSNAYQLANDWQKQSRELKWRVLPAMGTSLLLLISTGAFGGAADPASALGFKGFGPLSAAHVHLLVASVTVMFNLMVNVWEYNALSRNGQLVNEVLQEVRRMRTERGLPV